MKTTSQILKTAKTESLLAPLSTETKNAALSAMAEAIVSDSESILSANKLDMEAAEGIINPVMMDRLALSIDRIRAMADGIREVIALPDPVGAVLSESQRKDGLQIKKVAVPMGVVAIIYESRPNVTADAAALAVKSGNVCVLRSGKEAYRSAKAIVESMKKGLISAGVSPDRINLIEDTSRESANELMRAKGLVDLLIPRGGAGLIRACVENATVNCIETGTGICHVYIDSSADLDMAVNIMINAKTSRPSVCNSAEVCLVHKDIAKEFLTALQGQLQNRVKEKFEPVELRLDERAIQIIDGTPAGDNDFDTEFLDYILAIRIVDDIEDAISHISAHSTGHSESIVTKDSVNAQLFVNRVDSAAVYVNASTRFTDGGEFGLGCEMGISTQKLHARGPMGLAELCTYKWIIEGKGHIR